VIICRFTILALILAAGTACGQVTVQITQAQDDFLPGESLPVAVRITNRSGQTLQLGSEADWLIFSIESSEANGAVVPKTADAPVLGPFELPTSKAATKHVDLAPYFQFGQAGRYEVTATVRIKDWDREITSPPKHFNIIEGTRLWERDFGLPNSGTNGAPEVRKYILQQANYLKGQIRLYFRLTDSSGFKPFRVYPVGSMVSFSRPEPQLDRLSNLHLLYQNGPSAFGYFVFNPDGEMIKRQTFDYISSRPRLNVDSDGEVTVKGGVRRETPNDIPPPKEENTSDPAAKSAAETSTNSPAPATDPKPPQP
jgi:hypothetical protein